METLSRTSVSRLTAPRLQQAQSLQKSSGVRSPEAGINPVPGCLPYT
jgi:hypothetical protein